jgi:hypothetical protein
MPEITDSGKSILETTLQERFGQAVPYDLGDAEIRLAAPARELSARPAAFRQNNGCHFVLFTGGRRRYRCQFFHRNDQQHGTGVDEFDDLTECVVSFLQAQADHLAQERGDVIQRR